jgi:signal peptidase I
MLLRSQSRQQLSRSTVEARLAALALGNPSIANAEGRADHRRRSVVGWVLRLTAWVGIAVGFGIALLLAALTVGPRFLPYQAYAVISESMEPAIPTGSVVVLRPVGPMELMVGDVITFRRPGHADAVVTHRILGMETTGDTSLLITRGDANEEADPWRVPALSEKNWKLILALPQVGAWLEHLQGANGRLLLIAIPAMLLGCLALRDHLWRA